MYYSVIFTPTVSEIQIEKVPVSLPLYLLHARSGINKNHSLRYALTCLPHLVLQDSDNKNLTKPSEMIHHHNTSFLIQDSVIKLLSYAHISSTTLIYQFHPEYDGLQLLPQPQPQPHGPRKHGRENAPTHGSDIHHAGWISNSSI